MKKAFTLIITILVATTVAACAGPHGGRPRGGHHHHHGGSYHTNDWLGIGIIAGSAFIGAAVGANQQPVIVQPNPSVIVTPGAQTYYYPHDAVPQVQYVQPAPQVVVPSQTHVEIQREQRIEGNGYTTVIPEQRYVYPTTPKATIIDHNNGVMYERYEYIDKNGHRQVGSRRIYIR